MNEIISVIIPIYNVEPYLERCLDSVINQTYKNLEILLVDDGSTDKSGVICDDYAKLDNRIKVFHKKNGGVSSARNLGLDNAEGKYIAFVDSDDYLEPTMYEELLAKQKEQDYDMVYCKVNVFSNQSKTKKFAENNLEWFCKTKDITYFFIDDCVPCWLWRILYKKDLLGKVIFNEELFLNEDIIFLCQIFLNNDSLSVSFIDRYLYNYQVRNDSISHNNITEKSLNRYLKFFDILKQLLDGTKYACCIGIYIYITLVHIYQTNRMSKNKIDISPILKFNTRENYKTLMKYSKNKKKKFKYYLFRHFKNIYILLIRIKNWLKR